MRAAVHWARRNNRATILMSESNWYDRPRNWLKEFMKRYWVSRHYDAAFVGGEHSAAYLERLGLQRSKIWRGYDVTDNETFSREAARARSQKRILLLKLGLPEQYFLYVGRFSPEKNLQRLLTAYSQYAHGVGNKAWGLVMVGSGPLESGLKTMASSLGLSNVLWPGFQQTGLLPSYYALASCLILPSLTEAWGLVINEAMACGLPILASERCGAGVDLIFPGLNGYLFNPYNVQEMSSLMEWMTSGQADAQAMGEISQMIITRYTPENWAKALADCVALTLMRRQQVIS
jgi:glycosyltransferase involved in cell wall biosynthesis